MNQRRSSAARRHGAAFCMRMRLLTFTLGFAAMAHAAHAAGEAVSASAGLAASSSDMASCGSSATQQATNACAHEDFLAANSAYGKQYAALAANLGPSQRALLRKMQTSWLRYRTEACRFEAGPSAGGSVHGFVYWSCAARMTRARAAELMAQARCHEGDVACTVGRP